MANLVVDWLSEFKCSVVPISDKDQCEILGVRCDNQEKSFNLRIKNKEIVIKNVSAYWYRRGRLNWDTPINISSGGSEILKYTEKYLSEERRILIEYFHDYLESAPKSIGSWAKRHTNKLSNLSLAEKCGLRTPSTRIVSTKKELEIFFREQKGRIITKSISEVWLLFKPDTTYISYTELLAYEDIQRGPPQFFPTLFQQYIDKEYEIRVFVLKDKCFSMAILSQKDPQTSVDFRKYNEEKPNRTCNYQLPKSVEHMIFEFMKEAALDTGSIDLIKGLDGNYYFLEVNPVGQFGMIEFPSNYYIAREIAMYLKS